MSLKVVHWTPNHFDEIRHHYERTKGEEIIADADQLTINAIFLQYFARVDPVSGKPIEDEEPTEAL